MMTSLDIRELYFQWILKKVGATGKGYDFLLRFLFNYEFRFILIMDGNRYQDGISLRYQFGYENGFSDQNIEIMLDIYECSILEMMAALAIRIEVDTMHNTDFGDRTHIWFWDMVKSLGLMRYSDTHFPANTSHIVDILNRFMDREYSPNGAGGLVTIPTITNDMRCVDIWTQMNWKLEDYLNRYGG